MPTVLRFQPPHPAEGRRLLLGVLVSAPCSRVDAALVTAAGHGLDAQAELVAVATADVSKETTALFGLLAANEPCPPGSIPLLRTQLAELEAGLVGELLDGARAAPGQVLAAGVHDPGLWAHGSGGATSYLGLCDAAALAEWTGLSVIDAFPARDLAQGGQGGPITALAEWTLLRNPHRSRVLLDLGRTVHLTYLPALTVPSAASRIISFDVGPGTSLLDHLAHRLTGGEHGFDPGGRLAVQGRRIPELIAHWLADPYFDRPLPRWHPRGVRPERFLTDAIQMAVDSGWSVRDLLCSATHFVAEAIAMTLRRRLPEDAPLDEIVVAGGGQHNGMLLREIDQLTGLPLVRIHELGMEGESLGPASIAVLALLCLDQIPANQTAITKAEIPRLLGRLTPGSPQNWQRLLEVGAGSSPTRRPLRSAL